MIELEVRGLPPLKNTASSFLNPAHTHAARVRALLGAARDAKLRAGFAGFGTVPLGLEMVVQLPEPVTWDATNALGDVLQGRRSNVDLTHLGELAYAFLFEDDKQIREVAYREEAGNAGYRLRLWALEDGPTKA